MDLLGLARRQDQLKRITEIARILHRYDLADWIQKIPSGEIRNLLASHETQIVAERPWEERVRLALTELGTTFIKLGQILSTRQTSSRSVLAKELCKLQCGTPPDPPEVVRAHDPGGARAAARSNSTAEFEPNALASASDRPGPSGEVIPGQSVVVKVQHDGIEEKIRPDLELLMALAQLLENHVAAARAYSRSPPDRVSKDAAP